MADEEEISVVIEPPLPDVIVIVEPDDDPDISVVVEPPPVTVTVISDTPESEIERIVEETEPEFNVVVEEVALGDPIQQFYVGGPEPEANPFVPLMWLEEVGTDIYEMRLVL